MQMGHNPGTAPEPGQPPLEPMEHPAQQRLPKHPVAFVSLELLLEQARTEKPSPHSTDFGIRSSERLTAALESDGFQQL